MDVPKDLCFAVSSSKGSSKEELLFYRICEQVNKGCLEIANPRGQRFSFGDPSSHLRANLIVKHSDFYKRVLGSASLGLGESYMDGWWEVEGGRLMEFIGVVWASELYRHFKENWVLSFQVLLRNVLNSTRFLSAAKNCIAMHYDLGNDFFQLMLDPGLTYSCGYQLKATDSLDLMQRQKYDRICAKLSLENAQRLLDIGCGWGGMLLHAAEKYPLLTAKGITLSSEQAQLAFERLKQMNLKHRMAVEQRDYREIRGSFDRLVSIGMFEHVGKASYSCFFSQLAKLLLHNGLGLLHTIGVTDPLAIKSDPWISKYIFPGYRLPRLEEIIEGLRQNGLLVVHVENWKPHYAQTLYKWRMNFEQNKPQIQTLGKQFDQRFLRAWDYYLQGAEAGFRYGSLQVYQVLFSKGADWNFPVTFDF